MSIHPSLKSTSTMKRHRSVLTRLERVKILHERGTLSLEESSCLGLPKVRHLKIRIRKEKAATPAAGTGAAAGAMGATPGAGAPAGGPAAPAGKGASIKAGAPKAPAAGKSDAAAQPKKKV